VPSELTPSSLDRASLTEQETRNATQALAHLQEKMIGVSVELAQGKINQSQFQAIYTRYCEQKLIIEKLLADDPNTDAWQNVATDGHSGFLRRQYAAHVVGMLIIEIASSMTLRKLGDFDLPRELLVPILSSLMAGKSPQYEAGTRSTQIEGGRWLCFVPGEFAASIIVFSYEPSPVQLRTVMDLHRDFERINHGHLASGQADPYQLTFPQVVLFEGSQK
jgi:hypothetical protein